MVSLHVYAYKTIDGQSVMCIIYTMKAVLCSMGFLCVFSILHGLACRKWVCKQWDQSRKFYSARQEHENMNAFDTMGATSGFDNVCLLSAIVLVLNLQDDLLIKHTDKCAINVLCRPKQSNVFFSCIEASNIG